MFSKLLARLSPATIGASTLGVAALAFLAVARSRANPSPVDRESWQAVQPGWLHWAFAHQPFLLASLAAFCLTIAIGLLLFRAAVDRRRATLADSVFSSPTRFICGLHPLVAGVFVFALLIRLPTLPWGGFVNDDYGITRVNRTLPLLERLSERHNDHAIPGYRLEVAALDGLFGTWAPGWNLAILINYALSLWLLARVMRQFRIHPLAAAFAVFLFAISRTSSALLTGYYCLSNTLQITAFCFAAFLAGCKARETGHGRWDWIGLGLMVCGALIDISGIWILAGVPLLLFAESDEPVSIRGARTWLWNRRHWLLTWAVAAMLIVGVLLAVRLKGTSPDLPGASLGYENSKGLTIGGILSQLFFYFSGGIVLQMTAPISDDSPVAIFAVAFAAMAVILGLCVRLASARERRLLFFGTLVILLFALEVAVGRPLTTRSSFWVQHVATAHLLGVLVVAGGLSVFLHRLPSWFSPAQAVAATAGLGVILLATSGAPSAVFYGTKLAGIQHQQATLRSLGSALTALLAAGEGKIKALPVLEAACLRARFRQPRPDNDFYEFQYFLPEPIPRLSLVHPEGVNTLRFYDRRGPQNVRYVPDLREACGPDFARALARTPAALWVYGAPVELDRRPGKSAATPIKLADALHHATEIVNHSDGSISFTSDGGAELRFQAEPFDPQIRHLVELELFRPDASASAQAVIAYESHPLGPLEATVQINHSPAAFHLDLRRLIPFSVSQQVSNARLRFTTPGRYQIVRCGF